MHQYLTKTDCQQGDAMEDDLPPSIPFLLPVFPSQEPRSVSPAKQPHPLSSTLALSTSKGTSSAKEAIIDALTDMQNKTLISLSAMSQEINTLRTLMTDLTITNQVQAKEIQSLTTIVLYLLSGPILSSPPLAPSHHFRPLPHGIH